MFRRLVVERIEFVVVDKRKNKTADSNAQLFYFIARLKFVRARNIFAEKPI